MASSGVDNLVEGRVIVNIRKSKVARAKLVTTNVNSEQKIFIKIILVLIPKPMTEHVYYRHD